MIHLFPLVVLVAQSPEVVDLDELLDQARDARNDKRWAEAIRLYTKVLERKPEHDRALFERALVLSWAKRFDEAIRDFRRHLELYPEQRETTLPLLARVTAWSKRFKDAIALLEPAVALGDRSATLDSATFLSWDGQWHASLALTGHWLQEHPGDRDFRVLRGRVLGWAGRHPEARRCFEQTLAAAPKDKEALLGLAQLDLWAGSPESAQARLNLLTKEDAASGEAVLMESQVLQRQGRTRQARARAKAWLKDPELAEDARERLGDLAGTIGPWAELSGTRTDTNEGLRSEVMRVEGALPLVNGTLRLGGETLRLQQPGFATERPRGAFLGLRYPLGIRMSLGGGLSQSGSSELDRSTSTTLDLGWRLYSSSAITAELECGYSHGLNLATAQAVRLRTWTKGYTLGGNVSAGFYSANVSLERGDILPATGATARRDALNLAAGRRFPLEWGEARAGFSGRMINHDRTLPLGFFMPERFRFYALAGGLTWRREGRFEASLDAQAGDQSVNRQAAKLGWGYAAVLATTPWGPRFSLFAAFSESAVALPASGVENPADYREHTLRVGLRVRGR